MRKAIAPLALLAVVAAALWLNHILVFDFPKELFSVSKSFPSRGERSLRLEWDLPRVETMSLKVSSRAHFRPLQVTVNGSVIPDRMVRTSRSDYFLLPPGLLRPGPNTFVVDFAVPVKGGEDVYVRLGNFIRIWARNKIAIFYADNHIFSSPPHRRPLMLRYLIFAAFLLAVVTALFAFPFSVKMLICGALLLPADVFLAAFWLGGKYLYGGPLAVTGHFFFGLQLKTAGFFLALTVIFYAYRSMCGEKSVFNSSGFQVFLERARRHVFNESMFDRCLMVFLASMLLCAAVMSFGLSRAADLIANTGLVFLIVGVIGNYLLLRNGGRDETP